ncbi:MAG: IclR family transcriptional regulator [Celeribacter sp.]|jgi:DNA-binding IclR family transcriptional regulator
MGTENLSHLGRAFAVLESLVEPKSSAEISRELDVNRSTALRLLRELEGLGYVRREPNSLMFALDANRIRKLYAGREIDAANWRDKFDTFLQTIRDEFGEAAILGVPANNSMVYASYLDSNNVVALREQIGTVRSMHCSALGQAYLSTMEEPQLAELLKDLSYLEGTSRAPQDETELRARLVEIQKRGYAIDNGETFEGGMCIAVPARVDGKVIGSLGLSGPTSRMEKKADAAGERLMEFANRR